MAEPHNQWIEVFRAPSAIEGQAVCDHLSELGIAATLIGEASPDALSSMSASTGTLPTVVVPADQAEQARAAVEAYVRSLPPPATDPAKPVASPRPNHWAEITAVCCIGVFPHLISAADTADGFAWARTYLADAFQLTASSACIIFATLFIIRRSGEPSATFGLFAPRLTDPFVAVGIVLVPFAGWGYCFAPVLAHLNSYTGPELIRPAGLVGLAAMLVQHLFNGYAEELVTRAYLLTRFEQQFQSRGAAVAMATALFAAYHGYQGLYGVAHSLFFGLVLSLTFLWLRRLWPLALAHALYNILIELL